MSLIEVLMAIVLLGLGVSAILVALRTTTTASSIDEDHAIAFSWLQDASEEIYRSARLPCNVDTDGNPATTARQEAIAAYSQYANNAARPTSWPGAASAVITVTNVQYLGRTSADQPYEWGDSYCLEGGAYTEAPQYTQRVTIQVTTPKGLVKTLQMVKGQS